MTPDRWQTVTALFDKAARLPIAQRDAFLVAACGTDAELLLEVRSLLEVHTDDPEYLEESALASHGDVLEEAIEAQTREEHVGAYRLLRKIGAGGMGSVYLAERNDDAFRKQVAIKFIRAGTLRETAVKRFRRERQILARLEHPGIARLLDGGTTDKGTPYFVMEYIEGSLLLDYCDQRGLDVRARLKLFLQVCEAVEYAHERLIVHRDLKASNILVDAGGNPKLLDFGIAKVLEPDEDGQLTLTQTGLRQFTPDYASPEQIRGEQVTTATDVYSLGVLLYEMLTGRRPFRFHGQSAADILSTLLESEPHRPSVAVLRQEQEAGKVIRPELVAWNRRMDLKALSRSLRGDLDNIILKALTKRPEERYRTASAFANDLRAHLDGHLVTARKATFGYRVQKFLVRNRWQTALGTGIALTILLALGMATWQWRTARTERVRAERHSQQSREMARSLVFDLYDAMREVPGTEQARQILLARASMFLDGLAESDTANPQLRLEIAESFRKLAAAQSNIAMNAGISGEGTPPVSAAAESLGKAIQVLQDMPGSSSGREQVTMRQRTVSLKLEAIAALAALHQMHGLAGQPLADRSWDELASDLDRLLQESSSFSQDQLLAFSRGVAFRELGNLYAASGRRDDAARVYSTSQNLLESVVGDEPAPASFSAEHAQTLKRIAALSIQEGRQEQALGFTLRALKTEQKLLAGRPHDSWLRQSAADTLMQLGGIQLALGKHDAAVRHYQDALRLLEIARSAEPRSTTIALRLSAALQGLGNCQRAQGMLAAAVEMQERSLRVVEDLPLQAASAESPTLRLQHARSQAGLAESLIALAAQDALAERRARTLQRSRSLLEQALATLEQQKDSKILCFDGFVNDQRWRQLLQTATP